MTVLHIQYFSAILSLLNFKASGYPNGFWFCCFLNRYRITTFLLSLFHEFFSGLIYECLGSRWSVSTHAFFSLLSYSPLAGIGFLYPCACVWLNASVHTIVHKSVYACYINYVLVVISHKTLKGHHLQGEGVLEFKSA